MDGRLGARTLTQQLKGLEPLFDEVSGSTVLDVGCAEGLISIALAKAGAHSVDAVELLVDNLEVGRSLRGDLPVNFECANANTHVPRRASYDIVLLLSILHKLKDPATRAKRYAMASRCLVVVRLPPERAPIVNEQRSGAVDIDIKAAIESVGFALERVVRGPFDEWTGYFRRPGR